LEILPELPRDLGYLMYDMYGESITLENTTPEEIQQINTQMRGWTELLEQQSKERCMARCSAYFVELMSLRWHPDRVFPLRRMGYKLDEI
jgi:hypothetical protein